MIEEADFDWGDDYDWRKNHERKLEEHKFNIINNFLIHLKELISSSSSSKDRIQISLTDLFKDFNLTREQRNYFNEKQVPYLAVKANLLKIDETVRPYEYILLNQNKKNIELRPYQKNIIEDATSCRGSVLVEAPTGSGKSVMACEIAKNEIQKDGKVLIVAPKIILLDQLKETFADLDPQIIHGAKDYDNSHNVFISTIQTAHKRDLGFEPTMILIDEVHYGFSGKMIKILLDDFKGKVVGLSATPYDERGESLEGFDVHINNYDLIYMIQNKYLHHPKCFAPLKLDLSNIGMVGLDYNQTDLDKEFNNIESISKIIETTKDIIDKRKASLIFCINIVHSEAVAKAFNDAGIPTKAIHSKLSNEEQKNILNDYKLGKIKMLANPVMLTTGFDHPITDTIILARPTQSQNLYRQMVGRALRLADDKTDAMIIDCSSTIDRLGLPTEKIRKINSNNSSSKVCCSECESERLYKKIKNDKVYLYCADCGNYHVVNQVGYECECCGLIHSSNANFKTINGNLYLVCTDCEHETLVDEGSSKEELREIFDENYVKEIQINITLKYFKLLMERFGPNFIIESKVQKQVKAIQTLIFKDPTIFTNEDISLYYILKNTDNSDKSYEWKMEYNSSNWRLIDENLEDEILNSGLKDLNERLKDCSSIKESFNLIKDIQKLKKIEIIDDELIEKTIYNIKKSKVPNIEQITNKRLKDLYFKNEDIKLIDGFVLIMESVLLN